MVRPTSFTVPTPNILTTNNINAATASTPNALGVGSGANPLSNAQQYQDGLKTDPIYLTHVFAQSIASRQPEQGKPINVKPFDPAAIMVDDGSDSG